MPDSTPSDPSPISDAKLAANRANAQHSTGPRTEQGKQHSRLNALKHGILAHDADLARIEGKQARFDYEHLLERLADEYQPETATEEILVQEIANATVRLRRVRLYETREACRNFDHERRNFDEAERQFLNGVQDTEGVERIRKKEFKLRMPPER